jgi:lipoprotein Spr
MKKVLFILYFLIIAVFSKAQDTAAIDSEQVELALCFKYSNEFGYNIESIKNPELYEVVDEWLGTPYKYSGETKKGIDCSGFACTIYRAVYNSVLSGSAKDIYERVKPINKDELEEGDLVFFKIKRARISHIGVYLGSNKFAHASTHNGVIISDLDEAYYKKYFYKGGKFHD